MLVKHNKNIILASTSSIRSQILKSHDINFEVIKPNFDEDKEKIYLPSMSSRKLSLILATKKAISVSKNYPNTYVIGSDQVCEFNNENISKSKNISEAIKQLTIFNNKVHTQNNATVIAYNGKIVFKNYAKAILKMRKLTSKQIKEYIYIDKPIGCAGSYKYESLGKHLFEQVKGDYYTILGLQIQPILNFLHSHKIIKL